MKAVQKRIFYAFSTAACRWVWRDLRQTNHNLLFGCMGSEWLVLQLYISKNIYKKIERERELQFAAMCHSLTHSPMTAVTMDHLYSEWLLVQNKNKPLNWNRILHSGWIFILVLRGGIYQIHLPYKHFIPNPVWNTVPECKVINWGVYEHFYSLWAVILRTSGHLSM